MRFAFPAGGLGDTVAAMRPESICAVALVASLATPAAARTWFEVGARLELIGIDQPLEFSCDEPCDLEEDPNCAARLPPEELCRDQTLDEPHDGWLFGVLGGIHAVGPWWGVGFRVSGTFGPFEPAGDPGPTATGAEPEVEPVTLGHVTVELPAELHTGADGTHAFVQVIPRLGMLNYIDNRDEEADTFTAGILLVAGFRFGGDESQVGVEAGSVHHPSFGGWFAQGTYRGALQ